MTLFVALLEKKKEKDNRGCVMHCGKRLKCVFLVNMSACRLRSFSSSY